MTVTVLNIIPAKTMESVQTAQYTSSGCKTVVDKMNVTNYSSANVSFSVNAVASGGSASDVNVLMKAKTLAPGESYPCPEVVGQVLESGGFLSTVASASNSLSLTASGRQIT